MRKAAPGQRDITQRLKHESYTYAFGAYPEKRFPQQEGYDSKYIREGGYFYYQISLSYERLRPVFFSLLRMLTGKVFIVAQIHTDDYYRESDTYISEEPGDPRQIERWIADWQDVVFDDGFFGIGAFCESPTAEVFLDEHKSIHVYHHDPDFMENALEQLGIPFVMDLKFFWDEPHYHEPLPLTDDYGDDYLTAFEDLADRYELLFDEDVDENTDDEGAPLGMTCWKVEVRGYRLGQDGQPRRIGFYTTLYLNASSRGEAIDVIETYMEDNELYPDLYLQMARVPEELLSATLRQRNPIPEEPCVWFETERTEFDWDGPDPDN